MARPSTAIQRELRQIRTAFNQLARSFGRVAPLLAAQNGKPEPPEDGQRRKPRLSAAQRKALKLQGKYIAMANGPRTRKSENLGSHPWRLCGVYGAMRQERCPGRESSHRL